jgi:hypothetical protein
LDSPTQRSQGRSTSIAPMEEEAGDSNWKESPRNSHKQCTKDSTDSER